MCAITSYLFNGLVTLTILDLANIPMSYKDVDDSAIQMPHLSVLYVVHAELCCFVGDVECIPDLPDVDTCL